VSRGCRSRSRHQEVRRLHVALRLELGHRHRGGERHVDVVAQQHVAGARLAVEERKAVAAGLRGVEQL
jgi:hypothetical protein